MLSNLPVPKRVDSYQSPVAKIGGSYPASPLQSTGVHSTPVKRLNYQTFLQPYRSFNQSTPVDHHPIHSTENSFNQPTSSSEDSNPFAVQPNPFASQTIQTPFAHTSSAVSTPIISTPIESKITPKQSISTQTISTASTSTQTLKRRVEELSESSIKKSRIEKENETPRLKRNFGLDDDELAEPGWQVKRQRGTGGVAITPKPAPIKTPRSAIRSTPKSIRSSRVRLGKAPASASARRLVGAAFIQEIKDPHGLISMLIPDLDIKVLEILKGESANASEVTASEAKTSVEKKPDTTTTEEPAPFSFAVPAPIVPTEVKPTEKPVFSFNTPAVTSKPESAPAFTLNTTPVVTSTEKESTTAAVEKTDATPAPPSFSFEGTSATSAAPILAVPDPATSALSTEKKKDLPVFSFGANSTAPKTDAAPSFSFGSSAPQPAVILAASVPQMTEENNKVPVFSFGKAADTPVVATLTAEPVKTDTPTLSFGTPSTATTAPAKDSTVTFAFGESTAPSSTTESNVTSLPCTSAPASTFSFVPVSAATAPSTTSAFSFGSTTTPAKSESTPFSFGNQSNTTTTAPPSTLNPSAPTFSFGNTTKPTENSSITSSSFGASSTAPVFGSTANTTFGNSSISANPSPFGQQQTNGFGPNSTTQSSTFGSNTSTQPNSFGSNPTTQASGFGATPTQGTAAFGSMSGNQTNSGFSTSANQSSINSGFGSTLAAAQSTSFGAPATPAQSTSFTFGQQTPQPSTTFSFGQPQPPQQSFTPQFSDKSLGFGQPQQQNAGFGQQQAGAFAPQSQQAAPSFQFGQQAQQQTPGFQFGAGGNNAAVPTFNFGATPTGGMFTAKGTDISSRKIATKEKNFSRLKKR